jgi:hypothetical protein
LRSSEKLLGYQSSAENVGEHQSFHAHQGFASP